MVCHRLLLRIVIDCFICFRLFIDCFYFGLVIDCFIYFWACYRLFHLLWACYRLFHLLLGLLSTVSSTFGLVIDCFIYFGLVIDCFIYFWACYRLFHPYLVCHRLLLRICHRLFHLLQTVHRLFHLLHKFIIFKFVGHTPDKIYFEINIMEYSLPKSMEHMSDPLQLFMGPVVDPSINMVKYQEYRPTTRLTHGTPITFTIPEQASDYLNLKKNMSQYQGQDHQE